MCGETEARRCGQSGCSVTGNGLQNSHLELLARVGERVPDQGGSVGGDTGGGPFEPSPDKGHSTSGGTFTDGSAGCASTGTPSLMLGLLLGFMPLIRRRRAS